nr:GNAT family N-acetyltransferase [uncultured Moellerella sp.]
MKNANTQIPVVETERLLLTPHRVEDHAAVAEMWADPRITQYIFDDAISTTRESWMRMLSYQGLWPLLGYGYWAIKEKSTGRYVGDLGFADFYREIEPSIRHLPEAGWALAHWAHGKGYATEALTGAINWLQQERGIKQCVCLIESYNTSSVKLAERVGFKKTDSIMMDDKPTDLYLFG